MNNSLITLSGVHGVGKSTIMELLNQKLDWNLGIKREKNPFQSTFQAMLFFICSFSWRDQNALKELKTANLLLDRWSFIDIQAYIKGLVALELLTREEGHVISNTLIISPSRQIKPQLGVLLDAPPETILYRLETFRKPSKHHIFERDISVITAVRHEFYTIFKRLKNENLYPETEIIILDTNDKTPEDVVTEIQNFL
jgi:thymidylate kinase